MKQLYNEFNSDVQFFFVYCKEAHAIDSDRPIGTTVEQPISTEERLKVASDFVDEIEMEMPALLDKIDNKTGLAYQSHPDRMYLVGKDGKIAWAGGKGPRGFIPDELRNAILSETGKKAPSSSSNSGNRSGGADMMFQMMPVLSALDADKNGEISSEEIENATAALKTLDKNEDGELDGDEVRPQRGQRGGGQRGGGQRGGGRERGQRGGRGRGQ